MATHHAIRERWGTLVERWRASGLSAAEFCRREQISSRRFYKWRRKLASARVSSLPVLRHEPADFVPLSFAPATSGVGCGIAVVIDAGVRLELSCGFDQSELVRAVTVLRRAGTC